MIFQWDNIVLNSFKLYLNNKILKNGSAFTNVGSYFYPINQTTNGYYTYAAPYGQMVSDFSIPGANVPTGIYVNGTFTLKGQNGFVDYNYDKGQAYFTTKHNTPISGSYAVKDLSLTLPNVPHLHVLFDQKLNLRPKVGQTLTGMTNDELSYPAIFIRQFGGDNKPYAFGGLMETNTTVAAYIFADSQFLLDATCSLMKDLYYEYVPILDISEDPYNGLGGFKNNTNFNYTNLVGNRVSIGSGLFIKDLTVTDFSRRIYAEINDLTPNCYFATVDFTLTKDRLPPH